MNTARVSATATPSSGASAPSSGAPAGGTAAPVAAPNEGPPSNESRTRTTRGAVLLGGRQLLTIFLSALTAILLARWLTPSDYGLFATLNLIVFGAATLLGDLGLTVSLVRQSDEPPAEEWAAARRMTGALSSCALLGGAIGTTVLSVRGDDRLALWVGVLTIALAARFARSIPSARLQRQQRFATLAAIETAESVLYFVTVLSLAANGHGAGSLAIAVGAKEVLGYSAQRFAARGGVRTRGVRGRYRSLLAVGVPIQASGLLIALTDAFQPIFIGATLGLSSLGLVSWAYNLVLMPILLLGAMDRVVLPSLARVQEDRVLLGLLTARAVRLNALISFPVVVAVLVAPDELIEVVFSPKWLPASDLLVLFMPAIVTTAMTAPLFHAFNAIGRTRVAMWLSLSWLVSTWTVGAYATSTWGEIGFGWFYVLLQLAYVPVWRLARRELGVNVLNECRDTLAGLGLGVAAGAVTVGWLDGVHTVGGLFVGILVAEVVFLTTTWLVDHERSEADVIFLVRGLTGRQVVTTAAERATRARERAAEPRWRLGHIQPFDGLRALAVLAVMVHHAHVPRGLGGFLGVDIFFVLSGFLITALLVQERDRNGRIAFGRFYMRRALRLFPALIVMTIVVGGVLVGWRDGELRSDSFNSLPFALAYLTNYMAMIVERGLGVFGHTWSLAIEEQFYLLWPPVLAAGLARWRQGTMAAAALAGAAVIAVVRALVWLGTENIEYVYFPLHARGDALLIGCAAALVMTGSPARMVERVGHRTGWVALGAGGFVLAVAAVATVTSGWMYLIGLLMVSVAAVVVIAHLAARPDSRIGRLLGWRPLAYVGTISYGLYLWHFPVFELIKDQWPTMPFRYLVVLQFAASFAAALLSYRLVEKPFLALKRRFGA